MGDLRPDNGSEWGAVVIPDDAAELHQEAVALRRELRRAAGRNRLRRLFHLRPGPRRSFEPTPAIPFVIMAVALLTTLVSLFVVTWGRRPSQPLPPTPSSTAGPPSPDAVTASAPSATSAPASPR